jgi:hypothetical protein
MLFDLFGKKEMNGEMLKTLVVFSLLEISKEGITFLTQKLTNKF